MPAWHTHKWVWSRSRLRRCRHRNRSIAPTMDRFYGSPCSRFLVIARQATVKHTPCKHTGPRLRVRPWNAAARRQRYDRNDTDCCVATYSSCGLLPLATTALLSLHPPFSIFTTHPSLSHFTFAAPCSRFLPRPTLNFLFFLLPCSLPRFGHVMLSRSSVHPSVCPPAIHFLRQAAPLRSGRVHPGRLLLPSGLFP